MLLHSHVQLWQHPTLIHAASNTSPTSPVPVVVLPDDHAHQYLRDYHIHSNPAYDVAACGANTMPRSTPFGKVLSELDDVMDSFVARCSAKCSTLREARQTIPVCHGQGQQTFKSSMPGPIQQAGHCQDPVTFSKVSTNMLLNQLSSECPAFKGRSSGSTLQSHATSQSISVRQKVDFDMMIDAVMLEVPVTRVPYKHAPGANKPNANIYSLKSLLSIFEHIAGVMHSCLVSSNDLIDAVPKWSVSVRHVLKAALLDIGDWVNHILSGPNGPQLPVNNLDWHSFNIVHNFVSRRDPQNANLFAVALATVQALQDLTCSRRRGHEMPKNADTSVPKHYRLQLVISNLSTGGGLGSYEALRRETIAAHQAVLSGLLTPIQTIDLEDESDSTLHGFPDVVHQWTALHGVSSQTQKCASKEVNQQDKPTKFAGEIVLVLFPTA